MVKKETENKEPQSGQDEDDYSKTLLLILIVIIAIICGIFGFAYVNNKGSFETAFHHTPTRSVDGILSIREVKTRRNVTAWLVEDHSVPVITMNFAFKGAGALNETPETQGLVRLLSNTLDEGAGDLDSEAFQTKLNDYAIKLHFNASRDNFGGTLKTLSKNKDIAFDLLRMAITSPRFDEDPVNRMRDANIARIQNSLSNPDWRLSRLAYATVFEGHPYALNSGGTISTLKNITPDALRAYVQNHLTQDRLHVSIAGDITVEEVENLLEFIFGKLPATYNGETADIDTIDNLQNVHAHHDMPIPQTKIQLWMHGLDRNDTDYHAAQVLTQVLGGGFGSRLTVEARENRGLTYGIYSYLDNFDHANMHIVQTSTQNEKALEMLSIISDEISTLKAKGITQEELADAVAYMTGSLPLSLTSTGKISKILLNMQLDNLPIDYLDTRQNTLNTLTVDDVNSVADRIMTQENFAIITVGQPTNVYPDVVIEDLPNVE